jgi:hypothetical protein
MPTSTPFNLSALKAKSQAKLPDVSGGTLVALPTPPVETPRKKLTLAELKKKYPAIAGNIVTTSKLKRFPRCPSGPNAFTENERALLLRGVIDALRARLDAPTYRVWHRYGLSRIYFADKSWLSYDPKGTCSYGPSKETTAYAMRSALGLERRARRGKRGGGAAFLNFMEIDCERLSVECPVCGVDFNHAKTASIEGGAK